MKALIDGDILLYACGFAAQKNWHRVYIEGEEQHGYVAEFKYKKDLIEYLDMCPGIYVYETEVEVEPLSHAVHNVNQVLRRILEETEADSYTVYLTGKDNFRDKLVDYYKKNRDPDHKPHWYQELGEYLIEVHDAVIVNGQEADDAMGIHQYVDLYGENLGCINWPNCDAAGCHDDEPHTIICTTDKDLDMIPGWHYNWDKKSKKYGKYWVDEEQAIRWFYTQLLMGDSTDNIKGVPGCGKKGAKVLLEDCETESDMFTMCAGAYNGVYPDLGPEILRENADLLWIRREEDQRWEPPEISECVECAETS